MGCRGGGDAAGAAASLNETKLIAPEFLAAECANILWKKIRRNELSNEEALLAAKLLQSAEIELAPTRLALEPASPIAIELDHPATDCIYLALAADGDCPFVTADERLLRKLDEARRRIFRARAMSLPEADALVLRAIVAWSSKCRPIKVRSLTSNGRLGTPCRPTRIALAKWQSPETGKCAPHHRDLEGLAFAESHIRKETIKGGHRRGADGASPNASIPTPQPVRYRSRVRPLRARPDRNVADLRLRRRRRRAKTESAGAADRGREHPRCLRKKSMVLTARRQICWACPAGRVNPPKAGLLCASEIG